MKPITKEVKIALVAVVAIVILYFGMQFLKGLTMFSSDNNFYAHFTDVSGLSPSSPVYANGYRVGVVEDIDYDYSRPDNVVATIGLDKKMKLPRGTRAEITSDLLGNVKLELRFGENVLDADKVGFFGFKFFGSGFFAMLEFDNTGGFVKKLTAVFGLAGQNLVNLTLTDDGIAFFTYTGIVEKFVDIFKTADCAVDKVFAFAGSVYTSGYGNFVIIYSELMVGIIKGNGYISVTHGLS